MAYVRRKTNGDTDYFYLVEGTWVDGKSKQRVIAYLGRHKTVESAYLHWAREAQKKGRKQRAQAMMAKLAPYL